MRRDADYRPEAPPALAAERAAAKPDVIVADLPRPTLAVHKLSSTIAIVMRQIVREIFGRPLPTASLYEADHPGLGRTPPGGSGTHGRSPAAVRRPGGTG